MCYSSTQTEQQREHSRSQPEEEPDLDQEWRLAWLPEVWQPGWRCLNGEQPCDLPPRMEPARGMLSSKNILITSLYSNNLGIVALYTRRLVFWTHFNHRPHIWHNIVYKELIHECGQIHLVYLPSVVSLHIGRLQHSSDRGSIFVEVRVLGIDVGKLDGHNVLYHWVGWL